MSGYFFLIITFLFYLSMTLFKPAAGHNDIISGLLLFIFYGVGLVSSLIVTIKVVQQGGFNWISAHTGIRNIITGAGWIIMIIATLISQDIDSALQPSELKPLFQWLAKSKCSIWLPWLMLVPYFFLLNSDLHSNLVPKLNKIILITGFALSLIMVLIFLISGLKKKEPSDISKLPYDRAIQIMNNKLDPDIWKFASRNMDERVRKYALNKIKENKNWEKDMIQELEGNNRYFGVYAFLDGNATDHPELFIEPIKNNIADFAYKIGKTIRSGYFDNKNDDEDFLRFSLDVERLCRILDEHFSDSKAEFRPNMIEVQKSLETEPLDQYIEIRNTYRAAVKNWLKNTNQGLLVK